MIEIKFVCDKCGQVFFEDKYIPPNPLPMPHLVSMIRFSLFCDECRDLLLPKLDKVISKFKPKKRT